MAGRDLNPSNLDESVTPLTPAMFHILLVLADQNFHGYAIMREVEQITGGAVRLGPGTLYRSMQRMELDGLIEEMSAPCDDAGEDERRRYYRLTRLGLDVARREARRLSLLVDASRSRGLLTKSNKSKSRKRGASAA